MSIFKYDCDIGTKVSGSFEEFENKILSSLKWLDITVQFLIICIILGIISSIYVTSVNVERTFLSRGRYIT